MLRQVDKIQYLEVWEVHTSDDRKNDARMNTFIFTVLHYILGLNLLNMMFQLHAKT